MLEQPLKPQVQPGVVHAWNLRQIGSCSWLR